MSQGTDNGTLASEVQASLAHELDQVPVAVDAGVQWQQLYVTRAYSGYSAQWLRDTQFFGVTPPARGDMWFPPTSWRQSYRKVYKNLTIAYTGSIAYSLDPNGPYWPYPGDDQSISWTSNNHLIGSGYTPQDDQLADYLGGGGGYAGMPQYWTTDSAIVPSIVKGWTGTSDLMWAWLMRCDRITCYNGDLYLSQSQSLGFAPYASSESDTHVEFSGFPASSVFPEPGVGFDVTPYGQTWTFDLSTELSFKTLLGTVATEIQAESYPAFAEYTTTQSTFNDFWENYDGFGFPDPAHWDGSVISIPGTNYGTGAPNPYFGANTSNPDFRVLWSGWYWTFDLQLASISGGGCISEEAQFEGSVNSLPDSNRKLILGLRTRFKTATAQVYCIFEATVLRIARPDGVPLGSADIAEVKLKATGTTTPGTLYDIPWPTDPGYDDWRAIPGDSDSLSTGKIRFAIIGESAATWSARTGIAYT